MYRYRFTINKKAVDEDPRPCTWPIDIPYWLSGENDSNYVLIAFEEDKEDLLKHWPEAEAIEALGQYEAPFFTTRFPCPPWYRDLRMAKLQEKYVIFAPEWSWGTAHVFFRKDGRGFCHLNIYKREDIPSISDVFVQPNARKMGIGDELLRDAEELARLMHFDAVFLWAVPDGWCKGWYQRHGYRITRDYTQDGDVLMEKRFTINQALK